MDVKKEDGSKEKLLLYYDGESVSGQVFFVLLSEAHKQGSSES